MYIRIIWPFSRSRMVFFFFFFFTADFDAKDQLSNCDFINDFILENKNGQYAFMMDFIKSWAIILYIHSLCVSLLAQGMQPYRAGDFEGLKPLVEH